jgi:NTP pyrophosphatase (non-canonical NTP hydrolase)
VIAQELLEDAAAVRMPQQVADAVAELRRGAVLPPCSACDDDCTGCGRSRGLTLTRLQAENKVWADHNFPDRRAHQALLGAAEEIGELCHAHLKSEQGIRGTAEQHHDAKVDAVADVVIFLVDYCNMNGIDLQTAIEKTWAEVRKRDWRKDPLNAGI